MTTESAEDQGGRGQEGRHKNNLFYTDDGMFASSDPRWIQLAFSTLVGLLDRVGLKTNVGNTVGMVCHPYKADGMQSEAECGRRVTGTGPSYREMQRGRIQCKECG